MDDKQQSPRERAAKIAVFLAAASGVEHNYPRLMQLKQELSRRSRIKAAEIMLRQKLTTPAARPIYKDDRAGYRICPLYSQLYMFTRGEVDAALNGLIARNEVRMRYDRLRGTVGMLLTAVGKRKTES